MLVLELRELIKKYKDEELRMIITEMYKSMPKKLRECKDIDGILQDVNAYMAVGKAEGTKDKQVDVDDIKAEIEQFIDYAYNQYYFAPNNIVHKKERPKWRFKVKAYIKDLQSVPVEREEGKTATELMEKLYKMLSYACGYYIFNTEDPFRSVGIGQTTLIDTVIARKLGSGISKESVKSSIELVIKSHLDRETLHSSLIEMLVKNLKSSDSKEIAIDQCKVLKAGFEKAKPDPSRKSWHLNSKFQREEEINNLVETVFRLNMALCDYEEAIKYFKANIVKSDKEVALYILLSLLLEYKLKDYWIREYDEALKKGIKPREVLHKTYDYIKNSGIMPEYFRY